MKPAFGRVLAAVLFCTVPVLSPAAAEPDFIPLLDAGHTEGWRQCGNTEMRLNNGEATTRAPNDKARGVYWYANRPFRDFVIRLEYSLDGPTSNSGLFVRFPELGNDPQVASNEGYEIQIYGGAEGRNPTGAIWGFQPPTSVPQRMKGWNEMEVSVVGQHFTVVLNGQTVNEFTGTRRVEGYIGLQDYPGAPVHLRNVRIKDLSSASPATSSPAIAATQGDSNQARIEVLKEQAPNAVEWVLAPLDRTVPEGIRQNLMVLREDLLDEQAKAPAASAATYKLGQELCNRLVETLNERDQARVRAGYTAAQAKANMGEITNQALEARRTAAVPSGRRTSGSMAWPTYFREVDQREELRKQKQNGAALENQRPILEWADRGAQIRKVLDAAYAQFREAARQPLAPK